MGGGGGVGRRWAAPKLNPPPPPGASKHWPDRQAPPVTKAQHQRVSLPGPLPSHQCVMPPKKRPAGPQKRQQTRAVSETKAREPPNNKRPRDQAPPPKQKPPRAPAETKAPQAPGRRQSTPPPKRRRVQPQAPTAKKKVPAPRGTAQSAPAPNASSCSFSCASCGEGHSGTPSFAAAAPFNYALLTDPERASCPLGSDDCVIRPHYFVRCCIDIPVLGQADCLTWGVWASLSEKSYAEWRRRFGQRRRKRKVGPLFAWLNTCLPGYPETLNLKTLLHVRDDGLRPCLELEPTDHPLAVEQRTGISAQRVASISALVGHSRAGDSAGGALVRT